MGKTLEDFLRLFTGGIDGHVNLIYNSFKTHRSFPTHEMKDCAAYAIAQSTKRDDIYIRTGIQPDPSSRTSDTVSVMNVVTIDFDIAGPGHKASNLPTSLDDFERYLALTEIPKPTLSLNTGGGLLALWQLETPIKIETHDDRIRARRLSSGIYLSLAQRMKEDGFSLDNTSDLVRACRLPFTRNWKPAYGPEGAPVTIKSWSGATLPITELERITAAAEAKQKQSRITTKRAISRPSMTSTSTEKPNWASIQAGCTALREWASIENGLSEPHWYALGGILARCEDGDEIFHDLSLGDDRYSAEETDNKLAHAEEAAGPRTCDNISKLGGACQNCPFRGRIHSPISLGFHTQSLVELASRWVFVASENGFIDLHEIEEPIQ